MGRFDYLGFHGHAQSPDMGVGNDDECREILVAADVAAKVIAAIPTENRFTEDVRKPKPSNSQTLNRSPG